MSPEMNDRRRALRRHLPRQAVAATLGVDEFSAPAGGGSLNVGREPYNWYTNPNGAMSPSFTVGNDQIQLMPFDVPFACRITELGVPIQGTSSQQALLGLVFEDYQGLPGDCIGSTPIIPYNLISKPLIDPIAVAAPRRVWAGVHNGIMSTPALYSMGSPPPPLLAINSPGSTQPLAGLKRDGVTLANAKNSWRTYTPASVVDFFAPTARCYLKLLPPS